MLRMFKVCMCIVLRSTCHSSSRPALAILNRDSQYSIQIIPTRYTKAAKLQRMPPMWNTDVYYGLMNLWTLSWIQRGNLAVATASTASLVDNTSWCPSYNVRRRTVFTGEIWSYPYCWALIIVTPKLSLFGSLYYFHAPKPTELVSIV